LQNQFSRAGPDCAVAASLFCGADHAVYYINKPGFPPLAGA